MIVLKNVKNGLIVVAIVFLIPFRTPGPCLGRPDPPKALAIDSKGAVKSLIISSNSIFVLN